ncbi:MAG: hypothetical protein H6733_16230 [Alphaproteobacteria bacterium]|nr:hypothetical protein [Alphaproteobacteria bacterium]
MRHVAPLVALVALTGCAPSKDATSTDTDTLVQDTEVRPDTSRDTDRAPDTDLLAPLAAPRAVDHDRWATVEACTDCHSHGAQSTALTDAAGRDISPASLWPATMMGNAARDPIWRAVMERETTLRPAAAAVIEDTCMTCHAPMAQRLAASDGALARAATLWADADASVLGLDGVGCTVCHQIAPDGLGTPATFTGQFALGPERTIFGPHADPFANPMQMHAGFTPVEGDHLVEARLCGSCHTVITPVLDDDGAPAGATFHEQTTYLEWRNSSFTTEGTAGPEASTCQDCHVPTADADGTPITTRIARRPDGSDFPPVSARAPVGRHVFVGANTTGLGLLRDHADALRPRASTAAFDAQIARTRAFLADAVHVDIGPVRYADDRLTAAVTVRHDAGHRFPSGFPSRRAWVELTVTDDAGTVLFRSGGWDADGRLVDATGTVLTRERAGGPGPGHVDVVDTDDVVASWEVVMAGLDDQPTFSLLSGADHHRDDRLLPRGWSPSHPDAPDAHPTGVEGDADFGPGQDTVHLDVALPGATGPLHVTARVAYQPLSARWRAELAAARTPAALRLDAWLTADAPPTEVVAHATRATP